MAYIDSLLPVCFGPQPDTSKTQLAISIAVPVIRYRRLRMRFLAAIELANQAELVKQQGKQGRLIKRPMHTGLVTIEVSCDYLDPCHAPSINPLVKLITVGTEPRHLYYDHDNAVDCDGEDRGTLRQANCDGEDVDALPVLFFGGILNVRKGFIGNSRFYSGTKWGS